MTKPAATFQVRNDPFDQWRASEVGATIGFDSRGVAHYQFKTRDQYMRFLELNALRRDFNKDQTED